MRTVIAGYHWFTDWGRDTMISLEGLTLTTGRTLEAGYILRTFAHYVRDGLIPNMFPDGENEGLYHTADATLWFFHALGRYLDDTEDRTTLRSSCCRRWSISPSTILRGTKFDIHVDPDDGLLVQGAGRLSAHLDGREDGRLGGDAAARQGGRDQRALVQRAAHCSRAGCARAAMSRGARVIDEHAEQRRAVVQPPFLVSKRAAISYDVVDGDGGRRSRAAGLTRCSRSRSIIRCWTRARWASRASDVVERELLTPVGLRSLSPNDPDYKPIYDGDLRSRDGAYHQGTVWAWLIGPFVDAWLKVHPDEHGRGPPILSRPSRSIWTKPASARSAKSSTREQPHLARAAASPRPGAWPKCCAAGSRPRPMPESAEELSQHADIRQALDQTTGQKPKPTAETGDKFWFATHLLLLVACGVIYYLVGSHFVPFPKNQVDLVHRLLRGTAIIVVLLATSSAISLYAVSRVADPSTRFTLKRIKRLIVFLLVLLVGVSVIFVNWYTALISVGVVSVIVGLSVQTPMTSFIGLDLHPR